MKFRFYFWVFIGGMFGSALREAPVPLFPAQVAWLPILMVNVIAGLIIGFVYGIEQRLHHHLKTFYAVGFCGGFSTFSHFSYQNVQLLASGRAGSAAANIVLSVVVAILAVYVGLASAQKLYGTARPKR